MKNFWNNIAPESWKIHHKDTKNTRKHHEIEIKEHCTRPFHFLKRIINLSGQRPTVCPCSTVHPPISMYKFRDIMTFTIDRNKGDTSNNLEEIKSIALLPGKTRKFFESCDALNQETKVISQEKTVL